MDTLKELKKLRVENAVFKEQLKLHISDEEFDRLLDEISLKTKNESDSKIEDVVNNTTHIPINLKSTKISCDLLNRIGKYLQSYDQWLNGKKKNLNLLVSIDLQALLNDYALLDQRNCTVCRKGKHTSEDIYAHIITNFLDGKQCALGKCSALQRNTRDRMIDNSNIYKGVSDGGKQKITAKIQILDAIHTAIFHAFDTGYKLTESDMREFERSNNCANESDDENAIDYADTSATVLRKLVDARVNEFSDLRSDVKTNETREQSLTHSKFVTHITAGAGESEVEVEDEDIKVDINQPKNKKIMIYSSGHIYFYSIKAKKSEISNPYINDGVPIAEFYIAHKHKSLKDEIINNKIKPLALEIWMETSMKASYFLSSDYMKKMRKLDLDYYTFDFTGYFNDTKEPNEDHVFSILLYCNFTELSYEFTKTFRLLFADETRDALKLRHSNFTQWGNALQQMFHFFSIRFTSSNIKFFYHGVSQEMLFKGAYAPFNSPTSTSTNFLVASNFAKGGIILELMKGSYQYRRFFNCKFFSDFKNEEECLFFNSFLFIKFHSIRHLGLMENYQSFVKAICIVNSCMSGAGTPYKIVKKYVNIITVLINNFLGRELIPLPDEKYRGLKIPHYISEWFKYAYENMEMYVFCGWRFVSRGESHFRALLPVLTHLKPNYESENYPIISFNYEICISLAHKNLALVVFWWLPLTHQLINDILTKLIVDPRLHKLKAIEFARTDHFKSDGDLTVDEVFGEYSTKFAKIGWKVVKEVPSPAMPVQFDFAIVKNKN